MSIAPGLPTLALLSNEPENHAATIPSPPPRPGLGFLYFPPFRVQGYSVAGEESFVHIPELDLCFDVGRTAKPMLPSHFVALTHGHMDHSAGIAYYFSQRHFQGMGEEGAIVCPEALGGPIQRLMAAWIDIEGQRTPHKIIPMKPEEEVQIKPHIFLRAFQVNHRVPALGYTVVEKRSKLKEQYLGLPQQKLVEMKKSGTQITYIKEVPMVAYTGDTLPGSFLERSDVAHAKILLCECTFFEAGHQPKAQVGGHMHADDIVQLVKTIPAENIVLTHLSRRTHLSELRQQLDRALTAEQRDRVHILMDHRTNRARYEQQMAEAADVKLS